MRVTKIKTAPVAAPTSGRLLFDPDEDMALAQAKPRSVDDLISQFDPQAVKPEDDKKSKIESLARGAAQGASLGFADEITGALESAFSDKSYAKARDESRKEYGKAKADNPLTYGGGELGGGLLTTLVPGLNAAKGAKLATQVGRAALQGGLSGLGSSEADLTEGDVTGAAKDTAIGAGLGAGLTAVIGGGIGKYVDSAERRAVTNTTKDLTKGAIPTAQRRFAQMRDLAFQELEPDRAFMKAAKAAPDKARDLAQAKLNVLGSEVKPIYQALDKEVGKVPLKSITDHLDAAIDKAASDYGQAGSGIADALTSVKDDLVKTAGRRGETEVEHQKVRQWVTGLLKNKFRTMGSLSETENAHLAAEAHSVANDFLKTHLASVAAANEKMAPELEKLTQLNKKITAYASAEQLMSHKELREFWKTGGLDAIAEGKTNKIAQMAGVGAAVATGNPLALGIAAIPTVATQAARAGVSLDRKASAYLARLVTAARDGNASAQQIEEAIRNGVPKALVQTALAGQRFANQGGQ